MVSSTLRILQAFQYKWVWLFLHNVLVFLMLKLYFSASVFRISAVLRITKFVDENQSAEKWKAFINRTYLSPKKLLRQQHDGDRWEISHFTRAVFSFTFKFANIFNKCEIIHIHNWSFGMPTLTDVNEPRVLHYLAVLYHNIKCMYLDCSLWFLLNDRRIARTSWNERDWKSTIAFSAELTSKFAIQCLKSHVMSIKFPINRQNCRIINI